MASKYDPNIWELYNPDIPNEDQPHSFITKRKLDKMEEGIENANVSLEVGEVTMGDTFNVSITEDLENKSRKLNITFPPAGKGDPGEDGKSAYDIWLEAGNIGTEQEFLDYLKGIDGKDGKDGKDGADGAQGPTGESAYQLWLSEGNTGSVQDFLYSLKGDVGEAGPAGAQGPQGEAGPAGPQGAQGEQGLPGEKGETGAQGPQGEAGPQGEQGIPGEKGETGEQGPQGEAGADGEDGLSAYELWKLVPGNENKSITEFFESMKGEKGDPGEGSNIEFVDF